MAAVGQGHAQPPDPLTTARLRIQEQTQAFEIHLGHLARRRGRHAHRIPASAARLVAQPPDEAFQGGVRDAQAILLVQQLLHARQLQLVLLEPGRDLLPMRLQSIRLWRCPRSPGADHPADLDQLHHLVLGWRRPIGGHPQPFGGAQVLVHRFARHPTGAGDRTLRLTHLPATNHFDDLHATQLPISHPAHLVVADMAMNRAAGGLILRGDHLA